MPPRTGQYFTVSCAYDKTYHASLNLTDKHTSGLQCCNSILNSTFYDVFVCVCVFLSAGWPLTFQGNLTFTVVKELRFSCKQPTTCWTSHKFLLCVTSDMVCQFVYWAKNRLATCKTKKLIFQYGDHSFCKPIHHHLNFMVYFNCMAKHLKMLHWLEGSFSVKWDEMMIIRAEVEL